MALKVSYSAINTKLKAIMGKMLTKEDFKQLRNLSSVPDIFDYLYKNTYYKMSLESLAGTEEVHRRRFELNLKKSIVNDFQIIDRFLVGDRREFFRHLFSKYEVQDLKMLLRTILIEHDEAYFQESLIYLPTNEDIDLEQVMNIDSYQDLLDMFVDTTYHNVLARFADRYEENRNLFPIEMSLDLQYFSLLEKLAQKIGNGDYKYVKELLGTQVDLLNIQWIYRIKKYYNLSPGEIMNYILPFHYHVTREELNKMSQVDSPEEIAGYITHQEYKQVFQEVINSLEEDKHNIFEGFFLSYLMKKARKIKMTSFFNAGNIIAYLFLREYEIRDLITTIEGVRYSLPPDQIKKYLIREGV